MAILDRISTILRANLNDLLDKAEDPEKMLEQILRDMQSAIGDTRGQVAEMIAQQRMIESDVQRSSQLRDEWDAKARAAVQQNRDDLAREALRRKADYQKNVELYQQQLDTQQALVQKMKDDLTKLEVKYDDALRKRDELIARSRRAQAQQRVLEQSQQFDVADPTSELSRMEDKIRGQEARASAMEDMTKSTLDAQFEELEKDGGVEDELARMKQEMAAGDTKKGAAKSDKGDKGGDKGGEAEAYPS